MTKDARSGAMGKHGIDARALAEWLCDCAERAAERAGPPELSPDERGAMVEALIGSVPRRRPMPPRLVATTDATLAPEAPSPAPGTRETMTLLATGADPDAARARRAERLNDPSTPDEQRAAIEAANARDERLDALAGFPAVASMRRLAARLNDDPQPTDEQRTAIERAIDHIRAALVTWGPERLADREWRRALREHGGELVRAAQRFLNANTGAASDAASARAIVDLVGGAEAALAGYRDDPLPRPGEGRKRLDFLAGLERELRAAGFTFPEIATLLDDGAGGTRAQKAKRVEQRQRRKSRGL